MISCISLYHFDKKDSHIEYGERENSDCSGENTLTVNERMFVVKQNLKRVVCIVSENSISPWFENIANSTAHWKKCFGRKIAAGEDFKSSYKCRTTERHCNS